MTKKNRTGLQSKISHIFSGVPIPKKTVKKSDEGIKQAENEDLSPAKSENIFDWQAKEQTADKVDSIIKEPVPSDAVEALDEPQADISFEKSDLENITADEFQDNQVVIEEIVSEEQVVQITDSSQKATSEQPEKPKTDSIKAVPPGKKIPGEKAVKDNLLPQTLPFTHSEKDRTHKIYRQERGRDIKPSDLSMPVKIETRKKTSVKKDRWAKEQKYKGRTSAADAQAKRQKIMLVMFILLSILLVFLIFKPFSASSPETGVTDLPLPAAGDINVQPGIANITINWPQPPDYPADIKDPMDNASQDLPVETVIEEPSEPSIPVVSGITYSEDKPVAIIGADLFGENQVVNGYTIVEINRDSVMFEKDGKSWLQQVGNRD